MEPIKKYVEAAARATREEFAAEFWGYYLLKRPVRRKSSESGTSTSIPYHTVLAQSNTDPFASEWAVAPVKKRAGNPYPERISIGRATNCDIVLRVPFISKVHAHILCDPGGGFRLQDNEAQNSTFCNGRKLQPKVPVAIAAGDQISFGSMDFVLMDAKELYGVLRSEFD